MDQTSELIKQCLSNNKIAWDTFVDDYSRWIYHCILRTAHGYGRRINSNDTDELCQDVFVILLDKGLKQFKGDNKPCLLAYLRRIAVCHTINYLKKSNKYIGIDDVLMENGPYTRLIQDMEITCPKSEQERIDTAEQLKALLAQLSTDERKILEMCYFDHLSAQEISDKFLISVDTLYVRKNRVLNKLRNYADIQQLNPISNEGNHD
ncbi:MAG: sigma-70 family RNA polymerase sigma factor [Candidatus Omnitrophica bacterium]|nr:sigma-70 family RNA polymerase sigma factor [Candidatus Omnitrophota bacterium]